MGRPAGWMKELTGRSPMKSPGAPSHRREVEREFWKQVATGITSEAAAGAVGVAPAVGCRWFRHGGGMPPMDLSPRTGRYLSFAEREEIALLRAQGGGVRSIARQLGRSPSTVSRELRRNAATRCGSSSTGRRLRSGMRTCREATEDREAGRGHDCASTCRIDCPGSFEVPTARSSVQRGRRGSVATSRIEATAAGFGVGVRSRFRSDSGSISPMINRCGSATKRSTKPSTSRAGGAQARAGRVPSHRTGTPGSSGPSPPEGMGARHARGHDQRTARRGRRPGRPRALGRRSADRARALRDRHAGRAHHPIHDADPPATRGRLRHDPAHKERPAARRLRRGHDEERAGVDDDDPARAAPPIADLGPRQRTLPARRVQGRDRHPGLLRRPTQPLAARDEREHQRVLRQYFPKGTDLSRWSADEIEAVAAALNSRPRRHSAGELLRKRSTNIYIQVNKPVLRRPVESGHTPRSTTARRSTTTTCSLRSAASATPTTTPSPRASSTPSRPN